MAAHSITNDDYIVLNEIAKCPLVEYFYKDYSYMEIGEMREIYPELFKIFKTETRKDDMIKRLSLDVMKYIVW